MLDKEDKKLTLKELVDQGKLEVGDVIPFEFTKEADYTSKESKNGDSDQKFSTKEIKNTNLIFLGIENSRIKTMLEKPFRSFYLGGEEGYENGPKELDNISKAIFEGQRGVKAARSLKVEDVNEALGVRAEAENVSNVRDKDKYKNTYYEYLISSSPVSEKIKAAFEYHLCWLGRKEYHQIAHLNFEECTDKNEIVEEILQGTESDKITDKLEIHIIDLEKFQKIKNPKGELADWLNLILGNEGAIAIAS